MKKRKIILTGGGSAGHVTPNLALVPKLKELGYEIQYIGTANGIEKGIIKNANIEYHAISSGKLRRYFDIKNFTDPFKVIKGVFQAISIMRKEKPNIVFSKGGFVSVPVVIAAHFCRIPVIAHESDMTPGLANRISSPYCTKICVTFPESVSKIKGNKGVLTGTPIRSSLLNGNRAKGIRICGFENSNKPVLFAIGGSLGAKVINYTLRKSIHEILPNYNVIHICGKGNLDNSLNKTKGYRQFEYVDEELPHLMGAADIVISRAGANTIFELLALKKPNILIPLSKKSSRGDQILDAASFEKKGYSAVIQEEELTKEVLVKLINKIYKNRYEFIKNMDSSSIKNGTDNIINIIEKYAKK
ncbi:MAG: undecaprenyldiphospho-muramoylpentapeptide beta-N-acetylglucosaminyltransferase [Clostridium sp.]|nr:undecaprenyldiphospho-muramoylpentapeptide beta-N-acetylglucosaminyltransferase [Clostridium sp.]